MTTQWMVVTGVIWGITNALMKRAMRKDGKRQPQARPSSSILMRFVSEWIALLLAWEYSLPFVINLLASAAFFIKLGDSPISLAVPVTNATTFGATAIAGAMFGEPLQVGRSFVGLIFVVLGIILCLST